MEGKKTHKHIETGIDRLLNLINEKTEVSISRAANLLKAPKNLVDHWANTLEDAGLIISKLTWREKYLMSLDFYKHNKSFTRSFNRQLKSLYSSTKVLEDEKLKKRAQEIEKKMEILDKKLTQLKAYEAELEKNKAYLAKEKSQVCDREIKLAEQIKAVNIKAVTLTEKHREIETKQKNWDEAMARLHKDMTIRLVTFTREQSQMLGYTYQKLMRKFMTELDTIHSEHRKKRTALPQTSLPEFDEVHRKPKTSKKPAKKSSKKYSTKTKKSNTSRKKK